MDPSGALDTRFSAVRNLSARICEPLAIEDYVVQGIPEASPPKWHLAHTTWFFETFVLSRFAPGYRPFHPDFEAFFNSYYACVSEVIAQGNRGTFSRPTVDEVNRYRAHVDDAMGTLLANGDLPHELRQWTEVGLQHEQQHQELLVTDIKAHLHQPPLFPRYRELAQHSSTTEGWTSLEGGQVEIGHDGDGFAFDNESPRHAALLRPFAIRNGVVTNGEFLAFMADDGYSRPELWLSDGFSLAQTRQWQAPGYWHLREGTWHTFTLGGLRAIDPDQPLTHVSFYEADAFARWQGVRLPTEYEWEHAATRNADAARGASLDDETFHPTGASGHGLVAMLGDTWEWTASPYVGYPGYRPPTGALGEYNGKFMANQMVLRGGSCATPRDHVRATYRNFYHPDKRWQFTGIRLARDLD